MLPTCLSNVRWRSKVTPRSFAYGTGRRGFFKNGSGMSIASVFNNWRVPTSKNFVFSGLINNSFSQHLVATLLRSVSRWCFVSTASSIRNHSKIFESSTKESKLETCTIEGRSLVYREKRIGNRIVPCGIP